MPIYKYRCKHCQEETDEILVMRAQDEPKDCEQCGNPDCLERIIGKTDFKLKGKGWYRDGY